MPSIWFTFSSETCREVNATLETLIPERPIAPGSTTKAVVDVDDLDLLQLRMADGTLGVVEVSRMGTGATNDLQIEIFGELGALRLSSSEPDWLYVYDARDADRPLGGMRGFKRVETGQRFDGQVMPDWTMPMNFVRSHAECQYQFLKSIWEDRPPAARPGRWSLCPTAHGRRRAFLGRSPLGQAGRGVRSG